MTKINKNIVIAALARDCAKSLNNNISLVEQLRSKFVWSHVVVVENDSKDDTKQILNKWERESEGVTIISQDFGTKTIPDKSEQIASPTTSFYRIEKMAFYRNIYMDYISDLKHEIDYVIVLDIDIENFSVDGLVKSIAGANSNWGGIFSNGITTKRFLGLTSKIYFDAFAIYEYPFKSTLSYSQESLDKTFKTINKNTKKYKYYSVISAFSGIGIYKYDAIKELRYSVVINLSNHNEAVCEHIPFNIELIKAGYKNYISRDLMVIYGTHNFGLIVKLLLPTKIFDFVHNLYSKIRN